MACMLHTVYIQIYKGALEETKEMSRNPTVNEKTLPAKTLQKKKKKK